MVQYNNRIIDFRNYKFDCERLVFYTQQKKNWMNQNVSVKITTKPFEQKV